MNGIRAGIVGDPQELVDVEIGADGIAPAPDDVTLVGLEAMEGETVFVRVDRDRADAQLRRRAKHPDRDLAPIRDQQFAHPLLRRPLFHLKRFPPPPSAHQHGWMNAPLKASYKPPARTTLIR